MPYEILFSNEAELREKIKLLRDKGIKIEDCIIKVNKNNVKLKIRAKRTLYTAVLTPEKLGGSIEELKTKAQELATLVDCQEPKII